VLNLYNQALAQSIFIYARSFHQVPATPKSESNDKEK